MSEYGFVYLWFDRHNKMYYVGSHWGSENDGYICSSPWMMRAYKNRPHHFKRRVLKRLNNRDEMIKEEDRFLSMMKPNEFRTRYYNIRMSSWDLWHHRPDSSRTVGQKISAAKKGKKIGPRDPSIGKRISEAKKASFRKRREETGTAFSSDHIEKLRSTHLGKKHSEEWKKEASERMREQWTSGIRSRRS